MSSFRDALQPSPFAQKGADDCSCGLLNHDLAFECVLLLLARVELSLPSLGTLDRRFGDIDHHFGFAKASQQLFFARQAELPGLHQTVFEPMDNAANGSFTDSPTAGDVKVSAVLVPPMPPTPDPQEQALA